MPDRNQWNAAAVRMFDDVYSFVRTGPRKHGDWRHDLPPILTREVEDPRGWVELDWDKDSEERTEGNTAFPFKNLTVEQLTGLYEIEPEPAAHLLVTLLSEWFTIKGVWNFEEREEQLLSDARTLVARYGPDSACYTPSGLARTTKHPDFFRESDRNSVSGDIPFTDLMGDLGLIVVSDTEVGVFWAFNDE
ncbi:hypothetical protein [Streptomyces blastmyceticus]|uniref:Uncharacterized protein n=1 Tax=Streptomyces blastmyceticus TaxID=68180 RepID=A0ABN0WL08_9ACTN